MTVDIVTITISRDDALYLAELLDDRSGLFNVTDPVMRHAHNVEARIANAIRSAQA